MSGVSEGSISRILADKGRPTFRALEKLARALNDPDAAAELIAAYFLDRIPAWIRPRIQLRALREGDLSKLTNGLHAKLTELTPEQLDLFESLAELCARNEEICEVLMAYIKLLKSMMDKAQPKT